MDWRAYPKSGLLQEARDFRQGINGLIHESVQRGLSLRIQDIKVFLGEMDTIVDLFTEIRSALLPVLGKFITYLIDWHEG
jgi:hypothetical protein